jgi:hypothetical protein
MKISTSDYPGLQTLIGALGPPSHVFYSRLLSTPGYVYGALAVKSASGFYAAADLQNTVTLTQFLTDFPGAVEVSGVQGSY